MDLFRAIFYDRAGRRTLPRMQVMPLDHDGDFNPESTLTVISSRPPGGATYDHAGTDRHGRHVYRERV
jgi:hypothetical protein